MAFLPISAFPSVEPLPDVPVDGRSKEFPKEENIQVKLLISHMETGEIDLILENRVNFHL